MGWKLSKSRDEIKAFWHEIAVENRPRYKDPSQFGHLWVDLFVSFFSMSYTLGHVVGVIVIPLSIIYAISRAL